MNLDRYAVVRTAADNSTDALERLTQAVNEEMAKGWVLQGGVALLERGGRVVAAQAIVFKR